MARAQNLGQWRFSRGFAKAHEIIDRAIDLRLFDAKLRRSAGEATPVPRDFFGSSASAGLRVFHISHDAPNLDGVEQPVKYWPRPTGS